MGWLDGAKLLRPTGDTPHSLEEFRGMKVAVDISYYFHVAVRVPAAVAQYHAAPPVPVTGIIPSLRRIVDIANTFGIELVAVTDGTRHPGKAAVDESRAAAVASSIASITPLLAADRPADFNEVKKLRASASYVRADVLKVAIDYLKSQGVESVGAPFEADWQCAHLESISYVAAVISADADLFTFGVVRLVTNLDLNDGSCYIVERQRALNSEALGSGMLGDDGVIVLSLFMGNDFIKRAHGNGHTKSLALALRFMATDESGREEILTSMESLKWGKTGSSC